MECCVSGNFGGMDPFLISTITRANSDPKQCRNLMKRLLVLKRTHHTGRDKSLTTVKDLATGCRARMNYELRRPAMANPKLQITKMNYANLSRAQKADS